MPPRSNPRPDPKPTLQKGDYRLTEGGWKVNQVFHAINTSYKFSFHQKNGKPTLSIRSTKSGSSFWTEVDLERDVSDKIQSGDSFSQGSFSVTVQGFQGRGMSTSRDFVVTCNFGQIEMEFLKSTEILDIIPRNPWEAPVRTTQHGFAGSAVEVLGDSSQDAPGGPTPLNDGLRAAAELAASQRRASENPVAETGHQVASAAVEALEGNGRVEEAKELEYFPLINRDSWSGVFYKGSKLERPKPNAHNDTKELYHIDGHRMMLQYNISRESGMSHRVIVVTDGQSFGLSTRLLGRVSGGGTLTGEVVIEGQTYTYTVTGGILTVERRISGSGKTERLQKGGFGGRNYGRQSHHDIWSPWGEDPTIRMLRERLAQQGGQRGRGDDAPPSGLGRVIDAEHRALLQRLRSGDSSDRSYSGWGGREGWGRVSTLLHRISSGDLDHMQGGQSGLDRPFESEEGQHIWRSEGKGYPECIQQTSVRNSGYYIFVFRQERKEGGFIAKVDIDGPDGGLVRRVYIPLSEGGVSFNGTIPINERECLRLHFSGGDTIHICQIEEIGDGPTAPEDPKGNSAEIPPELQGGANFREPHSVQFVTSRVYGEYEARVYSYQMKNTGVFTHVACIYVCGTGSLLGMIQGDNLGFGYHDSRAYVLELGEMQYRVGGSPNNLTFQVDPIEEQQGPIYPTCVISGNYWYPASDWEYGHGSGCIQIDSRTIGSANGDRRQYQLFLQELPYDRHESGYGYQLVAYDMTTQQYHIVDTLAIDTNYHRIVEFSDGSLYRIGCTATHFNVVEPVESQSKTELRAGPTELYGY